MHPVPRAACPLEWLPLPRHATRPAPPPGPQRPKSPGTLALVGAAAAEGGGGGGGGGASASASSSASGEEAGGAPELSVSADNILQKIGEAMNKFAEKTGERLMLLQRVREVTNDVTAAEQELRKLEDLKKHFQLLGHLPVEGGEQVQEQLQEEQEEEERNVRQRSAEDSGVSL